MLVKKKPKISEDFLKREYLLPRGRLAFLWALKILKINKQNKILLPSYIGINRKEGSGVFDPIKEIKGGYEFYKINKDLSVNKADFERKLKKPFIKAVLVIHYFGFCQRNFEFVLKSCRENKKYLIEDCAHAFNSFYQKKRLGTYGDLSFYSIHKFLPVNDGGILMVNEDSLKICKNLRNKISHQTLMILEKSDLTKISEIKRNNYLQFLKIAKHIKGLKVLYHKLPKGITPLNFPVLIEKKDRNEVYFKLRKKGIETTSLYYRLISKIKREDFPLSYYISDHILNLPIHQDINRKDIIIILKELKKILNERV